MRDMKTLKQNEQMISDLRERNGNGQVKSGVQYEPNQNYSRLRVVRHIATDRMDCAHGSNQFSYSHECNRSER